MKLWKVVFETDGRTIKAVGVTETEIRYEETFYAAETAEEVWEAIAYFRHDPERNFFSLTEVLPMVTIIKPTPSEETCEKSP